MKLIPVISLFLLSMLNSYSQSRDTGSASGHDGIHADSSVILDWATSYYVHRGYVNIDDKPAGMASSGVDNYCLGHADNRVVSLGDSGYAILAFDMPIINTAGPDIAIYENSFNGEFLELAFVEVSSDSIRWVRFNAISETQSDTQVEGFGILAAGDLQNLAGMYMAGYGTPFDLDELKDSAGIDIMNINYIRVTDVIGSINPVYASFDSRGKIINDPWPYRI